MRAEIYILDDITIDMIEEDAKILIEKVSVEDVKKILRERFYINAIRDEEVLKLVSEILDINLTMRCGGIKLKKNDEAIIIRRNGEMYRIKIR